MDLGRTPKEIRQAIRQGRYTGGTAGLAPGYVQANLVILPQAQAYDFLVFCQRNPRPCPLIEVTDPGNPEPIGVAPGADLRTDIPKYRIYRDGRFTAEVTDITSEWRDDLVAFLLGCSFTFEWALLQSGVPILEALNIVKNATGNEVVASAIAKVHDSIREGESIAEPLAQSGVFDDIVINMIDVGEETGELDKMLGKVADFYEDEVDTSIASLTSIIEPIMMIGVGIMVGTIVIAMYLPMFKMLELVK